MDEDTSTDVIKQLEGRFSEIQEQKQERMGRGDDLGMAYRDGKMMGLLYAIETVQENGNADTDT